MRHPNSSFKGYNKSLLDIAYDVANYYLLQYETDEHPYIIQKKGVLLTLDLLEHLLIAGTKHRKKFDIKKELKKINKELIPLKTLIYNKWRNQTFEKEIINAENKDKYYLNLIKKYVPYNINHKELLKIDLGL